MPAIHPAALISTAVLGLLLFSLGFVISGARGKTNILIGVTPEPDSMLNRLVRAHGNTAEYAPFLAILFLLLGAHHPSSLVQGLIVVGTLARVIFVVGMLTCRTLSRPSPLRFAGAARTYVVGAWLSILLFVGA